MTRHSDHSEASCPICIEQRAKSLGIPAPPPRVRFELMPGALLLAIMVAVSIAAWLVSR